MNTLRDHYRLVIGIVVFFLLGTAIWVNAVLTDPPAMRTDTSFYQHAGWYISQGAIPYVNIWDVKPPVHFELQTILAFLSNGNMSVLHGLNILLSALTVIGSVYFTAAIIRQLTGNKLAALAGALTMLSFPYVYLYASMGFRNKLYVICAGTASLWLQLNRRHLWGGILGTVAAGFWQFGVLFPLMNFIMVYEKYNRRALVLTLIGVLVSVLLMLVPVIYWGALPAMIVEAVVVPIVMSEPFNPLARLVTLILWADFAVVSFSFGVVGAIILAFGQQFTSKYWFAVGLCGVLIQVFVIDLDSFPDAFLLVTFLSIGMGIVCHRVNTKYIPALFALIILSLGLNWWIQLGKPQSDSIGLTELPSSYLSLVRVVDKPSVDLSIRKFSPDWRNRDYWSKRVPTQCHYRLSTNEKEWMIMTNQPITTSECGKLEYVVRFLNR